MNTSFLMPERALVTPSGVRPAEHRMTFSEENEAKEQAYRLLGDLDDIELFFNDVLILKYIRTQLSENLTASAETQKEDKWQSSIGLVLKVGPTAFVDDEHTKFHGATVARGDWVMFRDSDGWNRGIQELYGFHRFAHCRVLQDAHIRARVKYPGRFMALEW
jgi:hypothetical protein